MHPPQVSLGISVETQSGKEPEVGRIQEVHLEEEKGNNRALVAAGAGPPGLQSTSFSFSRKPGRPYPIGQLRKLRLGVKG